MADISIDLQILGEKCMIMVKDKTHHRQLSKAISEPIISKIEVKRMNTVKGKDMLSYSQTTMMCFLKKEWYGFSAYTVNLFIKAYDTITYKEDLKIT